MNELGYNFTTVLLLNEFRLFHCHSILTPFSDTVSQKFRQSDKPTIDPRRRIRTLSTGSEAGSIGRADACRDLLCDNRRRPVRGLAGSRQSQRPFADRRERTFEVSPHVRR